MKVKLGNPTDEQHFEAMMAIARRHVRYQKELWRRLRAIMAEGRRDQSSGWSDRYIKLLQRAIRHQKRMERTKTAGYGWIVSRQMKPKPPALRVIRGVEQ